jgi:hypothetical protein
VGDTSVQNDYNYLAISTIYADINTFDEHGQTLLCKLCNIGESDREEILFLLENGADPNQGMALYELIETFWHNYYTTPEFIQLFHGIVADYGANVDYNNKREGYKYQNLLHYTLENFWDYMLEPEEYDEWCNKISCVITAYLQYGGNISSQDKKGHTMLSKLSHLMINTRRRIQRRLLSLVNNYPIFY